MAPSPSASFLARLRFFLVVVLPAAILMALEMVSSRLLAPHFGNSVYVWGSIIGVFLAAMSLGYAWGGRLADRRPTLHTLGLLLLGSAALQALVLTFGEGWTAALGRWTSASPSGTLIACGLLFAPPTVLLSTVSPFVVRLAAKQIELLGDTAGRLFAMSTAGSLAGTLGATFVLIPTLPLDAIFRLLMAATVVSSMLALSAAPRRSGPAFAIAAALGLYALVPRVAPLDDFVRERRQTAYQQLEVHATGTVRALYSNGVPQSMDDLATGRSLLPPVNGLALAAALVPTPERALIIGMGSGSLHSLERAVEGLQVDLVDVDPGVVDLAREHFALAADARTFADDGRRFLGRRPDDRWDIIVVDTYIGSSLPFHLSTQEFFQEIRRHLTPRGVVAINLASAPDRPLPRSVRRTLASVYSTIYQVPTGANHLLFALPGPPVDLEQVAAAAAAIDVHDLYRPPLASLVEHLAQPAEVPADATLLTDRFAPVNHLVEIDTARPALDELLASTQIEEDPP